MKDEDNLQCKKNQNQVGDFLEVFRYYFLVGTKFDSMTRIFSHAPIINWTDPIENLKDRSIQRVYRRMRMTFTSVSSFRVLII